MSSIRIESMIPAKKKIMVVQEPLPIKFTVKKIDIISGKLPGIFLCEVWLNEEKKFIPWAQKIEKLESLKDLELPKNTKLKLVFRNDTLSPVSLIIEIQGV